MTVSPVRFAPNLIDHFYPGGERIARFRGLETRGDHTPEEWVGATTHVRGSQRGPASTVDGELFADVVARNPDQWLGFTPPTSADIGVLVKLLDAGSRLPVHTHPTRAQSRDLLGAHYGKTEAWIILEHEPGAAVWLGWKESMPREELRALIAREDSAGLLSRMHRIDVRQGQGILVPSGTAHAIGDGILLAEVQEPFDASFVIEPWITSLVGREAHAGLDPQATLEVTSSHSLALAELNALIHNPDPGSGRILPAAADEYFRAWRVRPGLGVQPGGFAIVIATDGSALCVGDRVIELIRGEVLAIPNAAGDWEVRSGEVLAFSHGAGWPESLTALR